MMNKKKNFEFLSPPGILWRNLETGAGAPSFSKVQFNDLFDILSHIRVINYEK